MMLMARDRKAPWTQDDADALRSRREAAHLTQTELADKLGVTLRAVQNFEAGMAPSKPVEKLIRLFIRKKI